MKGIDQKLRAMEKNCVGEFPITETHLDFKEFPEAEQQMHLRAVQILNSHQKAIENILEETKLNPEEVNAYSDLSDAEMQIVSKSADFLLFRINKLYLDKLLILAKNNLQRLYISSRLCWLIQQLNLFLSQSNKEDEILRNESVSDSEKELQLKILGETWVRPFTSETWEIFWREMIVSTLHEGMKGIPEEEGQEFDATVQNENV